MPGRMGNSKHTEQNLRVEYISPEEDILCVKGAVPGAINSYLVIRKSKKRTSVKVNLDAKTS
jgi:large subunit ribosomal protein L3